MFITVMQWGFSGQVLRLLKALTWKTACESAQIHKQESTSTGRIMFMFVVLKEKAVACYKIWVPPASLMKRKGVQNFPIYWSLSGYLPYAILGDSSRYANRLSKSACWPTQRSNK